MKVLFPKKRSSCRFHGLGCGTNVKKKLKRDIWEREKMSLWVSVYNDNTCIVFIEKFNSNTIYLVRSWLLILSVRSWVFNVRCSNRWYLGRWFCWWDLGHSFWSVCDKSLSIINIVCTEVVWYITSIRNFIVTLNPKHDFITNHYDCVLQWHPHNN